MESFDPKPMLTKYAGKTIAETPFADTQDPKKLAIERLVVPDANGNQRNTLYPCSRVPQTWAERDRGRGLVPASGLADRPDRCRSLDVDDRQQPRSPAVPQRSTSERWGLPEPGAWVHYGLGSLNDNLPQYISMGNREYWNKKTGTIWARLMTRCPCASIRTIPSTLQRPNARFRPRPRLWEPTCFAS